jgi:ABC-2 type transport system ATP-binding protein
MMASIIKLDKLTKTYGSARGVEDISLEVPAGTIFGFLGPNGAGKSTTINMLINLTKPTSGEIEIFGKNTQEQGQAIRHDIGFLSSDMSLDGHLTGWQQVEYFGNLRGSFNKTYVQELAEKLDCNLNTKQRNLSRGNRQKVGLITALMHKPKLLILDEPTSGLDPLIQMEFNKIIFEHRAAGLTTFISSHVLSEVQELCDHVAFIRAGKLIANTTIQELVKNAPKHIRITADDAKLLIAIKKLKGVSDLHVHHHTLRFAYKGDNNALLTVMSNFKVSDISIENADLESTFMEFYKGGNNA